MPITPELKRWDCTDHHLIAEWVPSDEKTAYFLTLHVGLPGDEAADLFTVLVATPAGLARAKQGGWRVGPQPPIILRDYAWEDVLKEVQRRLTNCAGNEWLDIQDKLHEQFAWEYERN